MKKTLLYLSLVTVSLAVFSCDTKPKKEEVSETEKETPEIVEEKVEVKKLAFTLDSKSESNAKGEVTFVEENGEVTFTANLTGLEPGIHAIHIHEKADCSSPDGKSAGGHWNPTNKKHGKWGDPTGYHRGDIGNFTADENGEGTITLTTDEWCIDCEDEKKNIVGKGIIVHAGEDDFTSQPSGDAGARVSCGGVIE